MRERVLKLGPERNLVTVLTPAAEPARGIALIILNAGVLHRIGPHRMSVKLARHAASRGCTGVRFDLSGLGDSRPPADVAPHTAQAVRDVQAVMDELERGWGIRTFALFGICAGAEKSYLTAIADERVAGVFLMDGFSYPTLKGRLIHLAERLRRITPVKIARKLQRLLSKRPATRLRSDAAAGVLPHPPRDRFAADMEALVARGTRIVLTFSSEAPVYYAHQMHDAFARSGFMQHVVCRHMPDMNHTVTMRAAQARLLGIIDAWLDTLPAPAIEAAQAGEAPGTAEAQARMTSSPPM